MADGSDPRSIAGDHAFGKAFVRDTWYFLALGRQLKPGKMERRIIMNEPIVVGRTKEGKAFALRDVCPHRAAPLSAGRMVKEADGETAIECPYHGWRFKADGACSAIPSLVSDQEMEVERIRVRRYPVAESQSMVFIYMPSDPKFSGEPTEPVPYYEGLPSGPPQIAEGAEFGHHMDQATAGLVDPVHGPFVHSNWWWRSSKKQLEKAKAYEPKGNGFIMSPHKPSKNSRAYAILGGQPITEIGFYLPGVRTETIKMGGKPIFHLLTWCWPIDDTHCGIVHLMWCKHPMFLLLQPFLAAAVRKFLDQDAKIAVLQTECLKYDPPLLWIDDSDRMAKWYVQMKREWAASHKEGRPYVNPIKPETLRWRS